MSTESQVEGDIAELRDRVTLLEVSNLRLWTLVCVLCACSVIGMIAIAVIALR